MEKLTKTHINTGPGESIKEELEYLDWKQEDLAYILDISSKHLNEIINNKKPITLELAKLLGKVFKKTPQYWINLDTNYRLRINDIKEKEETLDRRLNISKCFPLNELFKKGWIEKTKDLDELERRLKDFLKMDILDFFRVENEALPDFKKSTSFDGFNPFFARVWYQKAKNSSANFKAPKYNKSALECLYNEIHSYSVKPNGVSSFLKDLNETGVKFMVLPHLQKTYLDGAAFRYDENPVIVYTCRHNRIDNFWFTVAHEIAHVLYHLDDNGCFLDDIKTKRISISFSDNENTLKKEEEANTYAAQKLLENEILNYFDTYKNYITEERLLNFSNAKSIHPSIVVGMLAHHDILSYVNMHRFNESVQDKIPLDYHIE